MKLYNVETVQYNVSGLTGFSLTEALNHWKSKYETIDQFKKDVVTRPGLEDLGQYVEAVWETLEPLTLEQALKEPNIERRRVMFDCIGVAKLFKSLDPELLDKQTVEKNQIRWREDNTSYSISFNDVYELYRIAPEKMFPTGNEGIRQPLYAVRCWCTTTRREFWIYVPEAAAIGERWHKPWPAADAVRAIAWTIRIDVSNPVAIYRQGDIIIVQESENSETVPFYHLSREQYLTLIVSES